MAIFVSLEEMEGNLSSVLKAVRDGKHVVVTEQNIPVASLAPFPALGKREFGSLKDKVSIGKDFFEPLPEEELAAWE